MSDSDPVLVLVETIEEPSWFQLITQRQREYTQNCMDMTEELPLNISLWKDQNVLSKAKLNQRHILLCLTTLGVTIASFKLKASTARVIRNSVLTYGGLGMFLTPEIVNPFLLFRHDL